MSKYYNLVKISGIIFSVGVYGNYILSKNNIISEDDQKLFNEMLWGVVR